MENQGTLFWGLYNQNPTIQGTILGSPILGNSQMSNSGFNQGNPTYDPNSNPTYSVPSAFKYTAHEGTLKGTPE